MTKVTDKILTYSDIPPAQNGKGDPTVKNNLWLRWKATTHYIEKLQEHFIITGIVQYLIDLQSK